MIPVYTKAEFKNCKSRGLLKLKCKHCKNIFYKSKNEIQKFLKSPNKLCTHDFCSRNCTHDARNNKIDTTCGNCEMKISIHPSHIRKSKTKRFFCSKSCSATYNNTHKTTGTRRSKLEVQLENQLKQMYTNLDIIFNDKSEIESELDIYIPNLKLAFELNGIFHYEPIFGTEKLNQIQNNDNNKFMKCQEKQISLCIIDTSGQKYFKESSSKKYLKIITTIIDQHLANS